MPGKISADYTARIRFRIPSRDRLGFDDSEIAFTPATGPHVTLSSGDKEKAIRDSDWLILKSNGWPSEEAASTALGPIMGALCRALAYNSMGADLGRRSPQGHFFNSGLRMLESITGRTTVEDIHGTMVFPTELRPMFARVGSVSGYKTIGRDRWTNVFTFGLERGVPFNEREQTAFDIFSIAHATRDSVDARFVLLFAAIEILLEDCPRPKPIVDHIEQLITLTVCADLDQSEKASLLGSLKWLSSYSIRTSGRRFVRERLSNRTYQDQSAEDLFLKCYELRNRLMHGGIPFPTRDEVGGLVGGLDLIVSHLLAGPVLEFDAS